MAAPRALDSAPRTLGMWMVTLGPPRSETSHERRPQPPRCDAAQRHLVRFHEDAERAHRCRHAGERRVPIDRTAPRRRRRARREPGLEVHVADLETALGAMGLG